MKRTLILVLLLLLTVSAVGVSAQAAPDTIIFTWSRNPESLFTDYASTATASYAMAPIYNGLVGKDAAGNLVPELAESWEVSDDQLTWTFHLRQGVTWHDGEAFTADDVKFTYEFPSDPAYTGSAYDDSIAGAAEKQAGEATETSGIQVIDDHTISFTTTQPIALFLNTTAQRYIVPEHVLGDVPVADLGTSSQIRQPIGTGAYKVVSFTPDQSIVYERYDGYWGEPAKVKNYIWRIIPEGAVQITELLSGTLDIVPEVPADEFANLETTDGISTLQLPGTNTPQILLNENQPFFADARARQALYFAIDRPGLLAALADGRGAIYDTLTHPSLPEFNANLTAYPYDPAQATALLAEIGWTDEDGDGTLEAHGVEGFEDGTPFSFELGAPARPPYDAAAQVIQQNLQQIGVQATVNIVDFGVFFSEYLSGTSDYVAGVSGWFNLIFPPQSEFEAGYHTDGPNTQYTHYSNAEVADLLIQARSTFDETERNGLYSRIQEIIQEEAPVIYLYRPDSLSAYNSKLVLPEVGSLTALLDTVPQWYWSE
jgi:peptide/nickel transport system substrate-binding protein